jgi:hypothetical protein
VLNILYAVGSTILPAEYYTHAILAVVGIITIYTFAQGRKTNRERDLHGRTILITVASRLNLHFLTNLADTCFPREPSPRMG